MKVRMAQVRCPHCELVLQHPPGASAARCGACEGILSLKDLEYPDPTPLDETAGPAGQMPLTLQCPSCEERVLPPAGAGIARCGSCSNVRPSLSALLALLARRLLSASSFVSRCSRWLKGRKGLLDETSLLRVIPFWILRYAVSLSVGYVAGAP